jgi:hypothetical protein
MTGAVTEVSCGGITYVIRSEPTGMMESPVTTLSSVAQAFAAARRLIRRDRTWTIAVRKRSDDPFGPTVHREVAPSRETAMDRAQEVEALLRSGELLR